MAQVTWYADGADVVAEPAAPLLEGPAGVEVLRPVPAQAADADVGQVDVVQDDPRARREHRQQRHHVGDRPRVVVVAVDEREVHAPARQPLPRRERIALDEGEAREEMRDDLRDGGPCRDRRREVALGRDVEGVQPHAICDAVLRGFERLQDHDAGAARGDADLDGASRTTFEDRLVEEPRVLLVNRATRPRRPLERERRGVLRGMHLVRHRHRYTHDAPPVVAVAAAARSRARACRTRSAALAQAMETRASRASQYR